MYLAIERFQSRGQHIGKFVGTNESVDIRKKFDFYTIGLEYQLAGVLLSGTPIWPP